MSSSLLFVGVPPQYGTAAATVSTRGSGVYSYVHELRRGTSSGRKGFCLRQYRWVLNNPTAYARALGERHLAKLINFKERARGAHVSGQAGLRRDVLVHGHCRADDTGAVAQRRGDDGSVNGE